MHRALRSSAPFAALAALGLIVALHGCTRPPGGPDGEDRPEAGSDGAPDPGEPDGTAGPESDGTADAEAPDGTAGPDVPDGDAPVIAYGHEFSVSEAIDGRELRPETSGSWTLRRARRPDGAAAPGDGAGGAAAATPELKSELGRAAPRGGGAAGVDELSSTGAAGAAAGEPPPPSAERESDAVTPDEAAPGTETAKDAGTRAASAAPEEFAAGAEADGPEPAPRRAAGRRARGRESVEALAERRRQAPLRAGSTDDNAHFAEFLAYLDQATAGGRLAGRYAPLAVRDRRTIRVVDASGHPLPGAEVLVVDEKADRVLGLARTLGDGRAPWYPRLAGVRLSTSDGPAPGPGDAGDEATESGRAAPEAAGDEEDAGRSGAATEGLDGSERLEEAGELTVQVRVDDMVKRVAWDGAEPELEVRFGGEAPSPGEVQLDVVFLIDTTGSMGDEIARIKQSLAGVTERLRNLEREFDLRYGAVLYRDIHDDYVTKSHPFTSDLEAFDGALQGIVATGGGDGPESLNQGLAVAVGHLDWREDAAKLVFLIADARPHMDYAGDTPYSQTVEAAIARGIRVHSVAASGLDGAGTLVFRQISQFTRGQFIFIEYGSSEASAASHGVEGSVRSNNLDQIIYERIREEVATWGRDI